MKAILKNNPIKVFNRGRMERDFTYVADIVTGIGKVINQPAKSNINWDNTNPTLSSSQAPFKIYNIGNNQPINLMEFIKILEEKIGRKAEKVMMPMQPGDVRVTYADVTDLIKELDYQPTTSLSDGIQQFVNWYRRYYGVSVKDLSLIHISEPTRPY